MHDFVYEALPQRVVSASGAISRVGEEISRLGASRAIVLTTPHQKDVGEALVKQLGTLCVGLFSEAAMHTPIEITHKAVAFAKQVNADVVVALGGGSTTGLGKAIALVTDLPQITIPTTYAGSEATPVIGQTENGIKTTQRTLKVLPEVIIYDVDLTLTLPLDMTVTSGINAIAHAVEALYSKDRNPVISALAVSGIDAIVAALPAIVASPQDIEGRAQALYGAWACGVCLGTVGMALHHKICHTLGGSFDMPHAQTHSVIIPHATHYNERAVATDLAPIAKIFGTNTAALGLWNFNKSVGAPMTLEELGFKHADLRKAVDIMLQNPYWNPQPLSADELYKLLENAFYGREPGAGF